MDWILLRHNPKSSVLNLFRLLVRIKTKEIGSKTQIGCNKNKVKHRHAILIW
jgi:hypothetical protein